MQSSAGVHITSQHITSHHITAHHITSHHITSHHITSHHITSHHITSHHITPQHITPHHITPHHITSHHITSAQQHRCCMTLTLQHFPSLCYALQSSRSLVAAGELDTSRGMSRLYRAVCVRNTASAMWCSAYFASVLSETLAPHNCTLSLAYRMAWHIMCILVLPVLLPNLFFVHLSVHTAYMY